MHDQQVHGVLHGAQCIVHAARKHRHAVILFNARLATAQGHVTKAFTCRITISNFFIALQIIARHPERRRGRVAAHESS